MENKRCPHCKHVQPLEQYYLLRIIPIYTTADRMHYAVCARFNVRCKEVWIHRCGPDAKLFEPKEESNETL